jgi:hypothetical protein
MKKYIYRNRAAQVIGTQCAEGVRGRIVEKKSPQNAITVYFVDTGGIMIPL